MQNSIACPGSIVTSPRYLSDYCVIRLLCHYKCETNYSNTPFIFNESGKRFMKALEFACE